MIGRPRPVTGSLQSPVLPFRVRNGRSILIGGRHHDAASTTGDGKDRATLVARRPEHPGTASGHAPPSAQKEGGVMRPARIWAGAIAALGAVAVAAPAVAPANEVTNWNRIATDTLVAIPGPAGGAPPALQINM